MSKLNKESCILVLSYLASTAWMDTIDFHYALLESVTKIVWVGRKQGYGAAMPHRHQVNGCFLSERGGVEGTPSTDKEFLALYLLPLGLVR